jgi:tight adherence protein B
MADILSDPTIATLLFGLLAAIALGVGIFAIVGPMLGESRVETRVAAIAESKTSIAQRKTQAEQGQKRRKAVADTLKDLDNKQKEKLSLRLRLIRAGFQPEPRNFWMMSGIAGLVVMAISMISVPSASILIHFVLGLAGTFGLPRWYLGFATKRRQSKFVDEFADALDVIVRGVKSGLPLNECLQVIARESPEPVRSIFRDVVEQQRIGIPLGEALDRAIDQMPLSEMKFFSIVISIQQQAGGNLAEAIGNLSNIMRSRKQMRGKVQALSAEAKASAYVLGSLPFGVTLMIYLSTPQYIMLLFTTSIGNFMLICCGVWMSLGILMMRKMINFKV